MMTPLFKIFTNYQDELVGVALHHIVMVNLFSGQVDFVGGVRETFQKDEAKKIWEMTQEIEDPVQ